MFSASLALLAAEFQGRERGLALGVWGAITGGALAVGPLVGGVLVDGLSWRWIFLVNLPIGVSLAWLTIRRLPESRDPTPRRLDVAGMSSFAAACFLGTYALIRGNEDGWASAQIIATLTVCRAACAGLRGDRAAQLPIRCCRSPCFASPPSPARRWLRSRSRSRCTRCCCSWRSTSRSALEFSATETGLRVLPLTLVLFAVAPISGRLTSRWPLRIPLASGLVLIGASLLLMRAVTATSDWTVLLPGPAGRRPGDWDHQPRAGRGDGRRAARREGWPGIWHQ